MRILHVIPGLADSSGPTQAVANLARAQTRLGHEVQVAAIGGRGTDPSAQGFVGVDVHVFPSQVLRYWGYSPPLARWLGESVAAFDFVHVHSLWLYPNLATARACVRKSTPYWVRPAGSLEPWCMALHPIRKRLYLRFIERRLMDKSAAVHAVSEQEADHLRAFEFRAPVVCIPNGVSDAFLRGAPGRDAARRRFGLAGDAPVLLFLSRIHPKKGLDILHRAFELVLRNHPSAVLMIAGPMDHDYAQEVRAMFEPLVRTGSTCFPGELRGADKGAAFAAADAFVLPSHSENFGIVVAEAMATGIPVVTSRNTPWQLLETEGAGFWEPLSPEAFASRMSWLLSHPDQARSMGDRGRSVARSRFSWDAIAGEVVAAYASTGKAWRTSLAKVARS